MPAVTIEPATFPRADDVQHALTGGGDGASCQCQWWMMPNADFGRTNREEREAILRRELSDKIAPGLVAYVDGAAAAWVRVGPRPSQPRLARTRSFAASELDWDDPDVWAVTCFVVRKEHRGQGLAARLLATAVVHARAHGARVIEAYPIDTTVSTRSSNDLFVGTLGMFLAAGFREAARPRPDRAIVELTVAA